MSLTTLDLKVGVTTYKQKGNLAYEYNPFRNYVIDEDIRITEEGYIIPKNKAVNKMNGEILERRPYYIKDQQGNELEGYVWVDKNGVIVKNYNLIEYDFGEKIENYFGDLDTEQLNFDLNNPVDLEIQPSYDGSVNIILNDNKNIPRMINSRFSPREKDTYEIVDRIGENDTNIYSRSSFDKDTSLYFQYDQDPIINFEELISGRLQVGQYCFYITYCDSDENESDIAAESGLIPVFIGADSDKQSMDGGIKNQESNKGIKLTISNLEKSYNYIKIYYIRYFADYNQHRVCELKRIDKKYSTQNKDTLEISITGTETVQDLDPTILNVGRFNASSVLTQAQCKNMLFFGNIHKNIDDYKELSDCALRIVPTLSEKDFNIDIPQYKDSKYYNSKCVYNYTGYMNNEYYRFGVVFIYDNGTLSNVYNTLGLVLHGYDVSYKDDDNLLYKEKDDRFSRSYVTYNEDGKIINPENFYNFNISKRGEYYFNSKGVCYINSSTNVSSNGTQTLNKVIGISFYIHNSIIKHLKKLGIRGFFVVRQKRIPEMIAQCLIMPMDTELQGPIIEKRDHDVLEYFVEGFLATTLNSTNNHTNEGYLETYENRLIKYQNDPWEDITDKENEKEKVKKALDLYVSTKNGGKAFAGICPDFLLNQPYYNQIFNGSTFILKKICTGKLTTDVKKSSISQQGYGEYNITRATYGQFGGSNINTENNTGTTQNENGNFGGRGINAQFGPKESRFYTLNNETFELDNNWIKAKICSVTEDVKNISIEDQIYRLEIGNTEEAFSFRVAGQRMDNYVNDNVNLVRGIYSPYLAIYFSEGTNKLEPGCIYNIYKENYNSNKIWDKMLERMYIYDAYYAISERISFDKLSKYIRVTSNSASEYGSENFQYLQCFRGDCYINSFTYRFNRNFNDPSLPNNDVILNGRTWYENISGVTDGKWTENINKIVRSDLNAVQMGSWITFNVMSSFNYAFRAEDHSYVSEKALMGSPRTYYPRISQPQLGMYKMPDSYLYNDAFRATVGYKTYFSIEEPNYLKNVFSNRIQYSEISIVDSYKNNYRESYNTYFRDYSQEYGSITKLVGFEGYILVIFEHAIGIAVINERILAGQGDGNPVFINTKNVLPEELTIISDTYGTQWSESVIKSEIGYVYGVDTISKKIWRVKGQRLEILSDFKVNSFLIDNISLGELEKYPIIGLKNVKTHYNNNKHDIMFTFYDDIYKDEEKVWNLCFNELLDQFVTFYSWVPSYSENIDTQYFSFDRNTSKNMALLWKSNYYVSTNYGVLLKSPLIESENYYNTNNDGIVRIGLSYRRKVQNTYTYINESDDTIINFNDEPQGLYEEEDVGFILQKDHWKNYQYFNIKGDTNGSYLTFKDNLNINKLKNELRDIIYLEITPVVGDVFYKTETVALAFRSRLNKIIEDLKKKNQKNTSNYFTSDFYLHGNSGIINIQDPIYPTYWYEQQHPFEFEFVVNDKIGQNKIFSNLIIVSNKAEPESFHFEIEGDGYEFSKDKRAMYFRQESTKEMYQNNGSDIIFNRNYKEVADIKLTQEQYYRSLDYAVDYAKLDKVYPIYKEGLIQSVKSTIFPLYYKRVDTYDEIYDTYSQMDGENKYDFKNLSGSEIVWNRDLNQFNIATHIKNSPINIYGISRGNSQYKDGKWFVQIPSITYMQKNEPEWPKVENKSIPPIVITSFPDDINTISYESIPNIYGKNEAYKYVGTTHNGWTQRKETRIRDKWIKIRVRYSGKNLAVIHSLITLYNNI